MSESKPNRIQAIAASVFLVVLAMPFLLCCCLAVGTHPLVLDLVKFPWTEWLTKDYLEAVSAGDVEAAIQLADGASGTVWYDFCQESLRTSAERDIEWLRGAEIRDIHTGVAVNTKSDESVVVGFTEFEYRMPDDPGWTPGNIYCTSDYDLFGKRYLCGCSLKKPIP